MNNGDWKPRQGDLEAAKEFMASVGGGTRGGGRGARGGRGGGRGGGHVGVRAGTVGSYKPYEYGGGNESKLLKELPASFYAPTNVLNTGHFAKAQHVASTQNVANTQSDAVAVDIDPAASASTPGGFRNTAGRTQPAQSPATATPATWATPATSIASTPGFWETTITGDHFGHAAPNADPWSTTPASVQPAPTVQTPSAPASTFWQGIQAPSSNAATPFPGASRAIPIVDPSTLRPAFFRGTSRAVPIVDPGASRSSSPAHGRASSPPRGLGVSVHASTPSESAGPTKITFGPNGSPVGAIQSFVSQTWASAGQQTQRSQIGKTTSKDDADDAQGKVSASTGSGLNASRWAAPSTEASVARNGSTGLAGSVTTETTYGGRDKVTKPVQLGENGLLRRPQGWDKDQGPVTDNNYQLTLHCDRLITQCDIVLKAASDNNDHNAIKAFDEVVKICMEMLHIKELKNNRELLKEAKKALKKTQKEGWAHWVKYWRRNPPCCAAGGNTDPDAQMQDAPAFGDQTQHASEDKPLRNESDSQAPLHVPHGSKFGGADQGGSDPISFTQQSRAPSHLGGDGTVGVGLGGPAQPFANLTAKQPQSVSQTSQQPGTLRTSSGFGFNNAQQPRPAALGAQSAQAIPFGGTGGQQTKPAPQQAQPRQSSGNPVEVPSRFPDRLPDGFDHPQAKLMLEDFFFFQN